MGKPERGEEITGREEEDMRNGQGKRKEVRK